MTTPAHAGRSLYVALPVADIERSKAFFAGLGFGFDPGMTGETSAGVLVGEHAFVMLLDHATFTQYAHLPMGDPRTHTQGLYTIGVATRDEVDTVTEAALTAGATVADGPEDHGFMYSRSFFDLDGHPWQILWLDPTAAQPGAAEPASATAR